MKDTTKELMEAVIAQNLERINSMGDTTEKFDLMKETKDFIAVQKELEEAEAKVIDATERRRLEEMKTRATIAIEENKQRFSWTHFLADIVRTGIVFLGSYELNRAVQNKLLKFEETGHLTSHAARSWHPIDLLRWVR